MGGSGEFCEFCGTEWVVTEDCRVGGVCLCSSERCSVDVGGDIGLVVTGPDLNGTGMEFEALIGLLSGAPPLPPRLALLPPLPRYSG